MIYLFSTLFWAFMLYIFCIFPRITKRKEVMKLKSHVYAHRGYHNQDYPENTLGAFERAKNHGYGCELDVQLTKDNVCVIAHDFHLLRACGIDKQIDECTYDELKEYKVFNSQYSIPKFEDVLKVIDHQVPLIIEIKQKGSNCQVCIEAQKILDEYKTNYVVESFNPLAMSWYKKNRPEIIRGQLSSEHKSDPKMNKYLKFSLQHSLLNFLSRPDFIAYDVNYRHEFTFKLLCKLMPSVIWTIQDEETYHELKNQYDLVIFENFKP